MERGLRTIAGLILKRTKRFSQACGNLAVAITKKIHTVLVQYIEAPDGNLTSEEQASSHRKKKKLKRCPATESSYYCNPRLASIGFNWYLNGALLKSRLVLLQEIPQLKSHRKNKILRFGTSSACDTLVQVKETMFLT